MNRTIASIVPTHTVLEGGGFKVRRPAAMGRLMSPFLLLDEMGPADYGPGEAIGAPSHPHRGFETVTYLLDGGMRHEDSAGNSGDLNPGDVQWMTAGRGDIHSELPQDHMLENGGRMHGFQIWVNLPAKEKMMPTKHLLDVRHGKATYVPSNEYLQGLYLATKLPTNKPVRIFKSKAAAVEAYRKGDIRIDDPITIVED